METVGVSSTSENSLNDIQPACGETVKEEKPNNILASQGAAKNLGGNPRQGDLKRARDKFKELVEHPAGTCRRAKKASQCRRPKREPARRLKTVESAG